MRTLCITTGCLYILVFTCGAVASGVADPFPQVAASYLLQINGETLWAHKPNRRLPPASLTKIMTALIVLEKTNLEDIISVSSAVKSETGTRIGLRPGDRFRAGYLLAATLLQSANDACCALAEHVGGSQEKFVRKMNLRAKKMGLKNTHFTNACGHSHANHYSTASDLAILTETALKNEIFAELVSFVRGNISTVDGKRTFIIENKNELIGRYQGAIGVKTGFTHKAGKCLIALAERNGVKVLLILLNAPNRWWDAEMMLDKAFAGENRQVTGK